MSLLHRLTKEEKAQIEQNHKAFRSLSDPYQEKQYIMLKMKEGLSLKDLAFSHNVPLQELQRLEIPVDEAGYLLNP